MRSGVLAPSLTLVGGATPRQPPPARAAWHGESGQARRRTPRGCSFDISLLVLCLLFAAARRCAGAAAGERGARASTGTPPRTAGCALRPPGARRGAAAARNSRVPYLKSSRPASTSRGSGPSASAAAASAIAALASREAVISTPDMAPRVRRRRLGELGPTWARAQSERPW